MDGLQSFKSLCDNIPEWHIRLDALAKEAADRHAEFSRQSRSSMPPAGSLRRQKTGSMESLRPDDKVVEEQPIGDNKETAGPADQAPQPEPVRVDINPDSRRLFQDYRLQSKRKRISPSMASNASGQRCLRAKHSQIVVYYDSAIQEHFSWLVRTIAGARNSLRKGKTAASFRARMAGMGMEESPFRGDHTLDISMRNPKIPRLIKAGDDQTSSSYSPLPFDEIDKELEAAQSLCEIGAHQFLREGVCSDEISGTKERFNAVLKIAKEQQELYREDAKIEQETRRDTSNIDIHMEPSPPLGSRSRLKAASAAVERLLAQSGSPNIETDDSASPAIAVEDDLLAVDPAVAVAIDSQVAIASDIAVDTDVAIDAAETHVESATIVDRDRPDSPLIAVDSSVAVDSRMALDSPETTPAVTKDDIIAVDKSFSNESIAVDKSFVIDAIAVDSSFGSGSIDDDHGYPTQHVAIDKTSGPNSIAVDTSFANSIAVDQSFTAASTATEKDVASESIAVDKEYTSIAVDDAFISSLPAISKRMATGISPSTACLYSNGLIEVDDDDDDDDGDSFHIDLAAFRRASRV